MGARGEKRGSTFMAVVNHKSELCRLAAQIHELKDRIGELEKMAHPPVDLTGAVKAMLAESDHSPVTAGIPAQDAGPRCYALERWCMVRERSEAGIDHLNEVFWTPWHIAMAANTELELENVRLREALSEAEATGVAMHLAWAKYGTAWEYLEQKVQVELMNESQDILGKHK
jgi:regulator of replication initiation timing